MTQKHNYYKTPIGDWLCAMSLGMSTQSYGLEVWAPFNEYFGIKGPGTVGQYSMSDGIPIDLRNCPTLEDMRLKIIEHDPGMGMKMHLLIEEYKDWLHEQDSDSPLLGG